MKLFVCKEANRAFLSDSCDNVVELEGIRKLEEHPPLPSTGKGLVFIHFNAGFVSAETYENLAYSHPFLQRPTIPEKEEKLA